MGCRCSTRDGFISYGAVGRWGGGNGRGGGEVKGGGEGGWTGLRWAEKGVERGGVEGKLKGGR